MKFFCKRCGTQAPRLEVCSGCGMMMQSPPVCYIVEACYFTGETASHYGPFASVMEADVWIAENWSAGNGKREFTFDVWPLLGVEAR